jgi:hypothetical protein
VLQFDLIRPCASWTHKDPRVQTVTDFGTGASLAARISRLCATKTLYTQLIPLCATIISVRQSTAETIVVNFADQFDLFHFGAFIAHNSEHL